MPTAEELKSMGFEPLSTNTQNKGGALSSGPTYNSLDLQSMGFQPLNQNQSTPPPIITEKNPLPGKETAVIPAQPADGGLRLSDIPKTIPNALGDIWNLVKEGTYGTAKKIVHDIPVAAYDLVKEQGIGNAVKNTLESVPGAVVKTASDLVPESAKQLLNTSALAEIPSAFHDLIKQNNGSYANALLTAIKSIPGALPDAAMQYANQIDRARQAVENHPVNEFLGYLGLKALAGNEVSIPEKSILNKNVRNVPGDTLKAIPGSNITGKMVRRAGDALTTKKELNQQPEPVKTAVKADIPQAQAEFIHQANLQEKAVMKQMLDLQEQGTKKLVMKPEERPDAKIGQQAMNMVKFLQDQKKSAQIVEGEHIKGLTNQSVDFSKTVSDFRDKLASLGVKEGENGKLDFSKSELNTPASAKDRGLLELTHSELKPNAQGQYIKPANELHVIRQRLFNETQNKNFTEPFSDRIISMIHNDEGTSVRSGLLHDISEQGGHSGKGYESETTKNAKIQDALQTFFKLIGKDTGARELNIKNLGAGEVANRLEGNASAKVENAFQKLEDTAKEFGFKSNVSVRKLVAFKTILKNIVGETQHNSLAGAVEQGAKAALPDALEIAGNAASGKVGGTLKAIGNFVKGNTKPEQVRALRNLLNSDYIKPSEKPTVITKTIPELMGVKPENMEKLKSFLNLGQRAAEKAGLGDEYQKVINHVSSKDNIDPTLGF